MQDFFDLSGFVLGRDTALSYGQIVYHSPLKFTVIFVVFVIMFGPRHRLTICFNEQSNPVTADVKLPGPVDEVGPYGCSKVSAQQQGPHLQPCHVSGDSCKTARVQHVAYLHVELTPWDPECWEQCEQDTLGNMRYVRASPQILNHQIQQMVYIGDGQYVPREDADAKFLEKVRAKMLELKRDQAARASRDP